MDFRRKSAHLKLRSELERFDSSLTGRHSQKYNLKSAVSISNPKNGEHMSNSELPKMMSKVVIDELSPAESEPSVKKSQDNKKT